MGNIGKAMKDYETDVNRSLYERSIEKGQQEYTHSYIVIKYLEDIK